MGRILLNARAILIALALALSGSLWSQGFDAKGFFGKGFQPDSQRPDAGVLTDDLTSDPPSWIDFSCSGPGSARGHFVFSKGGLLIKPDDKNGTCEALLDIGVSQASAGLSLHELDQGGAFAWHLHDLAKPGHGWLVELKHKNGGAWQLRIRVSTGGRYKAFSNSRTEFETLKLPAVFSLTVKAGSLSAEIDGHKTTAKTELQDGVSLGLAATDERARVSTLKIDASLHPDWVKDATERLLARRTLQRLREYATTGLLQGIAEFPYPGIKEALGGYSETERAARDKALGAGYDERFRALRPIAAKHKDNAAAQHEAGVAALLAGQITQAHSLLLAADKLQRTPVTSMALGEAKRRIGDLAGAGKALNCAKKDLPQALAPDWSLLHGRLLADEGDLANARKELSEAAEEYPQNRQLHALADSADALFKAPALTLSSLKAPLGLQLLSDMPDDLLKPVIAQLKPYIEKFHLWLPGLGDKLDGVLAVYSGPVEYLRAALIVAGDNLDDVAGMYLPHGVGNLRSVIACRAFGEDELLRTMVHELWHLAVASSGHDADIPRWINEGMAMFLSTGRYANGVMTYTRLPSEFGADKGLLDDLTADGIKAALHAKPQEFYLPSEVHANYLAAWAVSWYFATCNPDSTLIRNLLKGDAKAYAEVNDDYKDLRKRIMKALKEDLR